MIRALTHLLADDSGSALVEYTVLLASLSTAGFGVLALIPAAAQTKLTAAYAGFVALQLCPPGC